MSARRLLALLFALLALGAASCGGGGDRPTQVAAGGDPSASTTTTTAADTTTSTAAATTDVPATLAPAATTTTAAADPSSGTDDSPVAGLDASDLKAAVEAPASAALRAAAGPTVDQVVLPDGTRVWRVRVPGSFAARSARVSVTVGDRRVGEGVLAADLGSLTAVTTDGRGLTAGRAVRIQWEGSEPVAVGTLAVVR